MKYRKPVSVILIAAFVELTTSCTSLRRLSPDLVTPRANRYRIERILKTSGEEIEIDRLARVKVIGSEIHIAGRIRVPAAGAKVIKRDGGYDITPLNGSTYEASAFSSTRDHYVFTIKSDVVIPLSEVAFVWNKETNTELTILAVICGVAVAGGILYGIAALILKDMFNGIDWGF